MSSQAIFEKEVFSKGALRKLQEDLDRKNILITNYSRLGAKLQPYIPIKASGIVILSHILVLTSKPLPGIFNALTTIAISVCTDNGAS